MTNIPKHVQKYLWDVRVDKLNLEKHAVFIIERVLEYGDTDSLEWLLNEFDKEKILAVLKKSKRISPKTGNFYALYFGIPKNDLLCIRKPFTRKQDRF